MSRGSTNGGNNDRLGVVARLRLLAERQGQKDLAAAQQRLEASRRRLQAVRKPVYDGQGAGLTPAQLMALRAQGVVRAEDLEEAKAEWRKCEHQVAEAMEALRMATSRRKASEELLEKRRLATAAVAARAAQAALDELVVMRRVREVQ